MLQEDFLKYLTASIDMLYNYSLSIGFLAHKEEFKLLSSFLFSCAHHYPQNMDEVQQGGSYEMMTLKEQWLRDTRRLLFIANEIEGRKRPGPNDQALCHRIQSTIRKLKFTLPDFWGDNFPEVPEKVKRIMGFEMPGRGEGKGGR